MSTELPVTLAQLKELRRCNICGEEKPVEEFRVRRPGVLFRRCKACQYARERVARLRVTPVAIGEKCCAACGATKPVEAFPRLRVSKDGRYSYCRDCGAAQNRARYMRDRNRVLAKAKALRREGYGRAYYLRRRDHLRQRAQEQYLRRLGLDDGKLAQMLTEQNERCAICGEMEKLRTRGRLKRLSVDHDHVTGVVRALLCDSCNKGLGFFVDNPERLEAAAAYLRAHAVRRGA